MTDRNDKLEQLLDEAEVAFDVGDPEGALDHLEEAMRLPDATAVPFLMAGDLWLELGSATQAAAVLDAAIEQFPGDPDVLTARAAVSYQSGDQAAAEQALRQVLENDEHAGACFWLSQVVERDGDFAGADALLERAARLDPEHHHVPIRMERAAFESTLVEAIESLPPVIAEATKDVPILVHELPDDALLEGSDLAPDLLGLFIGPSRQEESVLDGTPAMPMVYVFQRNIERIARTRDELIEEARVTLVHELGHYLGLEEDELHELGLG